MKERCCQPKHWCRLPCFIMGRHFTKGTWNSQDNGVDISEFRRSGKVFREEGRVVEVFLWKSEFDSLPIGWFIQWLAGFSRQLRGWSCRIFFHLPYLMVTLILFSIVVCSSYIGGNPSISCTGSCNCDKRQGIFSGNSSQRRLKITKGAPFFKRKWTGPEV